MSDEKKPDSKTKQIIHSAGRIAKKATRATLLGSAILVPIGGAVSLWANWIYQVKTNYGVVETQGLDGKRVAVTEEGWHARVPLLSAYEGEYKLANQMVFLHGETEPHKVITRGAVVIEAAAATFYEIEDLRQYAIENMKGEMSLNENIGRGQKGQFSITPRHMIRQTLDSIITGIIQKTDPKKLIEKRAEVEKIVLAAIHESNLSKNFGIKFNGFRFTHAGYVNKVVEANAEKQALVAVAEGKMAAAKIDKKTIETLANADATNYRIFRKELNPQTPTEEKQVRKLFLEMIKYRTLKDRSGDTIWMLNEGNSLKPVFRPDKKR